MGQQFLVFQLLLGLLLSLLMVGQVCMQSHDEERQLLLQVTHITETETDTSILSFSWLPALPHFTLILPLGPSIRYRNNILT